MSLSYFCEIDFKLFSLLKQVYKMAPSCHIHMNYEYTEKNNDNQIANDFFEDLRFDYFSTILD